MENTTNIRMTERTFTVGNKEIVKNVLDTVSTRIDDIKAEFDTVTDTENGDTALAPVVKFTVPYIISDKALKKECNTIFNNITNIKTAMLQIGAALYRIKANRLWKKDAATRDMMFHEFVSETFGITRATAYRWIENVSPYLNADGQIIPEVSGMTVQQRTALLNSSTNGNGLSRKELQELTDRLDENPDMSENEIKQAIADIKADKVDVIPENCTELTLFAPDMSIVVPKALISDLKAPDTLTTDELYTRLLYVVSCAYKSKDVNTAWTMKTYTHTFSTVISGDTAYNVAVYTISATHGKGKKEYHVTLLINID